MDRANDNYEYISVMQNQLDRIIAEMKQINPEEVIYYQALQKNIINFKGSIDDVRSQFKEIGDIVISMGNLNFSRRLNISNSKDLFSFIGCSLNVLNEELEEKVISREFLENAMDQIMAYKPDLAVLTNLMGKIKFVSKNPESLIVYTKEELLNTRIQNFLSANLQFRIVDNGDYKDNEVLLEGKDSQKVPAHLYQTEVFSSYGETYFLYMFKEKKGA